MTCSSYLRERLHLAGYQLCSSCEDNLKRIDERGIEWAEIHKYQLARIFNANLRRNTGKIPETIRRRWLERQIVLAIKQSRKMAAKRVQQ